LSYEGVANRDRQNFLPSRGRAAVGWKGGTDYERKGGDLDIWEVRKLLLKKRRDGEEWCGLSGKRRAQV